LKNSKPCRPKVGFWVGLVSKADILPQIVLSVIFFAAFDLDTISP